MQTAPTRLFGRREESMTRYSVSLPRGPSFNAIISHCALTYIQKKYVSKRAAVNMNKTEPMCRDEERMFL
jgi:hypothetical protein